MKGVSGIIFCFGDGAKALEIGALVVGAIFIFFF